MFEQILFRDCFGVERLWRRIERLWRRIEQLKHVIDDLPQTVLQRKVIVHQIDQEVVVVDIFDDHPRRRLVFVEFGPLLDPQGKGLVLRKTQGQVW